METIDHVEVKSSYLQAESLIYFFKYSCLSSLLAQIVFILILQKCGLDFALSYQQSLQCPLQVFITSKILFQRISLPSREFHYLENIFQENAMKENLVCSVGLES